jgi:hypothetical protein
MLNLFGERQGSPAATELSGISIRWSASFGGNLLITE